MQGEPRIDRRRTHTDEVALTDGLLVVKITTTMWMLGRSVVCVQRVLCSESSKRVKKMRVAEVKTQGERQRTCGIGVCVCLLHTVYVW